MAYFLGFIRAARSISALTFCKVPRLLGKHAKAKGKWRRIASVHFIETILSLSSGLSSCGKQVTIKFDM